jgi:hypothetical protein
MAHLNVWGRVTEKCLCIPKVIEGKIKGRIEVTRRRGRRRKQFLDDLGAEEDTLI